MTLRHRAAHPSGEVRQHMTWWRPRRWSANVLPEQIEQRRAAGMQGHVARPIDPCALMAALNAYARPMQDKAAAT